MSSEVLRRWSSGQRSGRRVHDHDPRLEGRTPECPNSVKANEANVHHPMRHLGLGALATSPPLTTPSPFDIRSQRTRQKRPTFACEPGHSYRSSFDRDDSSPCRRILQHILGHFCHDCPNRPILRHLTNGDRYRRATATHFPPRFCVRCCRPCTSS